ncbi:MAG: nucleotidyltransferase [Acidobacteria bacterium]|nr:nucleotidyltransferase [Acidobacteriota bacterium]
MFQRLLEQIALGLEGAGIPYMVVGGQALLLHGEPRLTQDVDVTLGLGPDRVDELLDLAARRGWQVLVEVPQEFVRETLVLPCRDSASGIRIDFIFSFSTYERQALDRARVATVGSARVRFASAEDLAIHKIVAGRPRDLEDVRGILLKNPDLDLAYLRHWLRELDLSLNESFSDRFEELLKSVQ